MAKYESPDFDGTLVSLETAERTVFRAVTRQVDSVLLSRYTV
jgi:hypothetical protein